MVHLPCVRGNYGSEEAFFLEAPGCKSYPCPGLAVFSHKRQQSESEPEPETCPTATSKVSGGIWRWTPPDPEEEPFLAEAQDKHPELAHVPSQTLAQVHDHADAALMKSEQLLKEFANLDLLDNDKSQPSRVDLKTRSQISNDFAIVGVEADMSSVIEARRKKMKHITRRLRRLEKLVRGSARTTATDVHMDHARHLVVLMRAIETYLEEKVDESCKHEDISTRKKTVSSLR